METSKVCESRWCVALLAILSSVSAAAAPSESDVSSAVSSSAAIATAQFVTSDVRILLDRARDDGTRREALGRVMRAAERGNAHAQYAVGSQYRLGRRHPARLVEHDAGQAAVLLSNAAIGGEVYAMAGMAELLLAEGDARAALTWAQIFHHYEEVSAAIGDEPLDARRAYTASLLQRCADALGKGDDKLAGIDADAAAFIAQHDAAIRQALLEKRESSREALVRPRVGRLQMDFQSYRTPPKVGSTPGMAVYVVGVDPKGSVSKLLTLDSLPDEAFGEGMRRVAMSIRYNTAPEADELRWGVAPFVYDSRTIGFRER